MELMDVSDWMGVVGEGGRIVAGVSLGQQGWSIFRHRDCLFCTGSNGVSTQATDTCASFTSSRITERQHEHTPLAFGKLAVQLGLRADRG